MTQLKRVVYSASAFVMAAGGAVTVAALSQLARSVSPDVTPSSIQQTMLLMVDPAADALWESVGTEETARGTRVRAPRTDAEWLKLAAYADTLAAGAKRVQQPGLPVGQNAHSKLADADTPGTRTAAQIQTDIAADPARFRTYASRLQTAAQDAGSAARNHNAEGVLAAGAALDAACEACHAAYWYPRTRPQRLPSPDEFQKQAIGHR